ncbi:MAG TPA: penicillin-insensitive murein endopeptidase [Gaiellaceae bacterium]|nr:penicillin-insensitive murein endopeptidase [Gaiellaceae bacterium]
MKLALVALLGILVAVAFGNSTSPELRPKSSAPPPIVHDRYALPAPAPAPTPERAAVERFPAIRWHRSRALGLPWAGQLARGVALPARGRTFFTWDPVLRLSPNRAWRRVGSDRLVRMLVRVLDEYAAAHPDAPRVGIGDLSRPGGGDFGARYGLPGHASHQNGLDVDLYYPRLDRRLRPPERVGEIDRALSQDLVDRFVAAGARLVFVGPATGLHGNPRIVQRLAHHDNHLHVRLP